MRFLEALFPEMPPLRIITLFQIAPVFVERSEADKPGCAALPQGRHMPAPKVRADFDLLNNIATRFSGESDNITQMQSSITQAMSALEGGDWVGPGATAFYAEMRESVLPAVQRLIAALGEAGTTATKIGRTVKQAETDAARQLRSTGGSGARFNALGRLRRQLFTKKPRDQRRHHKQDQRITVFAKVLHPAKSQVHLREKQQQNGQRSFHRAKLTSSGL